MLLFAFNTLIGSAGGISSSSSASADFSASGASSTSPGMMGVPPPLLGQSPRGSRGSSGGSPYGQPPMLSGYGSNGYGVGGVGGYGYGAIGASGASPAHRDQRSASAPLLHQTDPSFVWCLSILVCRISGLFSNLMTTVLCFTNMISELLSMTVSAILHPINRVILGIDVFSTSNQSDFCCCQFLSPFLSVWLTMRLFSPIISAWVDCFLFKFLFIAELVLFIFLSSHCFTDESAKLSCHFMIFTSQFLFSCLCLSLS